MTRPMCQRALGSWGSNNMITISILRSAGMACHFWQAYRLGPKSTEMVSTACILSILENLVRYPGNFGILTISILWPINILHTQFTSQIVQLVWVFEHSVFVWCIWYHSAIAITTSPSSQIKVPPTSCGIHQLQFDSTQHIPTSTATTSKRPLKSDWWGDD
jgi:hypothetical protein